MWHFVVCLVFCICALVALVPLLDVGTIEFSSREGRLIFFMGGIWFPRARTPGVGLVSPAARTRPVVCCSRSCRLRLKN